MMILSQYHIFFLARFPVPRVLLYSFGKGGGEIYNGSFGWFCPGFVVVYM